MSVIEVPKYQIMEYRPKQKRFCVIVFVINEGCKIRSQLKLMKPHADFVDIIIADGGSTDGSLDDAYMIEKSVRAKLIKTDTGRLSAQMRMALSYSIKSGYDGCITIDGNNKDDPGAIPAFVKALESGYDHVQGSRFIDGGIGENTPFLRLLGIKMVHAPLISISAGRRYTDTTNGFRAYSKRFLNDERVAPFRHIFSHYELHYYLAIRAGRLGYNIKEIPVKRVYPVKGKIPTKISPIKGNLLILKTLIKACLHQYDPPEIDSSAGGHEREV